MLHLASRTDSSWAARAVLHLDEILLDHAHCEKKAAATAVGLIFRYPEHPGLAIPLSRLAREELAHFEQVHAELEHRGVAFRRLHPSPYASRLMACTRTHEPLRALDTLLCCALIEARSCERMTILANALVDATGADARLAALYRGLLASEARHHASYVELARGLGAVSEEALRDRWQEVAFHEARVIAEAPCEPRLHN